MRVSNFKTLRLPLALLAALCLLVVKAPMARMEAAYVEPPVAEVEFQLGEALEPVPARLLAEADAGASDVAGADPSDDTGASNSDSSSGGASDSSGGNTSDASGGGASDSSGGGATNSSGEGASDSSGGGATNASGKGATNASDGGATDSSGGNTSDASSGDATDAEGLTPREVTIVWASGRALSRTYDGTHNFGYYKKGVYHGLLSSSDFRIDNIAPGDRVVISRITARFDDIGVGTYDVPVRFTLQQTSSQYAYTVSTDSVSTLRASITPKKLTIRPDAGQNKLPGEADPAMLRGTVSGLLAIDKYAGVLSRKPGEAAGRYRITQGTFDVGDNYEVVVKKAYFTICTQLTLPADLDRIEAEAFEHVAANAVILPGGCTRIEARAFANCPNLLRVYIPDSIISISDTAFEGSGDFTIYADSEVATAWAKAHHVPVA